MLGQTEETLWFLLAYISISVEDNIKYSLRPKEDVEDLSKFECIYTLNHD
jgi:hypothetical protein